MSNAYSSRDTAIVFDRSAESAPRRVSTKAVWTGRIMSAIPVLILVMSGVMKLAQPAPVVESFTQMGHPVSLLLTIGILELACVAVYLIPRSAVLGALLVTGYLGGAVASNLLAGADLFTIFFPVVLGMMIWGGLFWRDDRLRVLLPLRK